MRRTVRVFSGLLFTPLLFSIMESHRKVIPITRGVEYLLFWLQDSLTHYTGSSFSTILLFDPKKSIVKILQD